MKGAAAVNVSAVIWRDKISHALQVSASASSGSCSGVLTQLSEITGAHVNSVLCANIGASSSGARDWCKRCFNHISAWPMVALNLSWVSWDGLLGKRRKKKKNLLTFFVQMRVKIIFNGVIALTDYQRHCWAYARSEGAWCAGVLWQRAWQRETDSTLYIVEAASG